MTRQEARAVNVVLDFVFTTPKRWDPTALATALTLLAAAAHAKLGDGWSPEKIEQATR
jgi:hypothetical protein